MDKKIVLLIFVIFCSFCLIGSASAADTDDVMELDDSAIELSQDAEIDEEIISDSVDDAVSDDTPMVISPQTNSSDDTITQTIGTYIGGNGNDKGKGIYTDDAGNIYVAMETNSNDLITTDNAIQKNITGGKDLYISKYSSAGELLYATYFGGSTTEMQKDLKVDSLGNVYIIGFTNSKDFKVTDNAFQKVINGSQDAFLTVINPNTGLVYSTYLGGDVVDRAWALAIDNNGSAYIQGITNSLNFPVTPDAFQKSKDGVTWGLNDSDDINYQNSFDLFLSKININSGKLEYSTYFGAKGSDSTYGSVAVDANEVIYFAGTTTSLDFPVTDNAFRKERAEESDSFIAALDIRNNKLVFSSYIGGNSTDDGEAIVLSPNGFLYYVGDTWSENFPTTENAFQTKFAGVGESISGGDMFIMKIDTSNWTLVYSTLLGGKFDEGVRALAVDEYENAWVVGMSQSSDYPVTDDAYQKTKNGPEFISYSNSSDYDYPTHDTVISKISPDGSQLLYSTYYGGNSGEFAMGITFLTGGFAIQTRTCSDDLFVTDNTTKGQDQFNGSMLGHDPVYDFDSYIAVFKNPTVITIEDVSATYGDSVKLTATVKDSMGDVPLAGKTIDFYVNGKLAGSAEIDLDGVATLSYAVTKAGDLTYDAKFSETIGHDAALATANLKVDKAKSKITAKNAKIKAKGKYTIAVKGNGVAAKKVKVTLKVNGKKYTAKTNSKGKATFKLSKLTKKGKYSAKIKFAGNKNFKAADKKVTLTVKK